MDPKFCPKCGGTNICEINQEDAQFVDNDAHEGEVLSVREFQCADDK